MLQYVLLVHWTKGSLEMVCYFSSTITGTLLASQVRVEEKDDEGYRCRAGLLRLGCTPAHWDTSDQPAP